MGKKEKMVEEFGERMEEAFGKGKIQRLNIPRRDPREARRAGRRRPKDAAVELDLDCIVSGEQCRKTFDEDKLQELASSMQNLGLIQAITVRPDQEDRQKYVILTGERRFRAAKRLGWSSIRCDIKGEKEALAPEQIAEIQLAENCAREDLNPIERARAFDEMIQKHGHSSRSLAERVGVNYSTVSRYVCLLNLSDDIQEMLLRDEITMDLARQAARLSDPLQQQEIIDQAMQQGMDGKEVAEAATQALAQTQIGYKPRERVNRKTDRQFTVSSGTRFRVTNSMTISPEQLQKDVLELVGMLEGQ